MRFMIYGATGYTGQLAARAAKRRGLEPIVGGRNAAKVRAIADELGFEGRSFALGDHAASVDALRDVDAVFNSAGPYSATAESMAAACLEARTHYLDVTAENAVFAHLQGLDAKARAAGVALIPGMGAGGAPTDCLANHLKARLPDAVSLDFFGGSLEVVSRGTAKSAMEAVHHPTEVRRGGKLVPLSAPLRVRTTIDGEALQCVTVPLCDVMVAWWSTRIPDVTTYVEEAGAVAQMVRVPGWVRRALGTSLGQRIAKWQLDRGVDGPSDAERAAGVYRNFAIVTGPNGQRAAAVARGPEGYTLTAESAIEGMLRAARGDAAPGTHTVSTAFGADFFSSLADCRIEDIDAPEVVTL